MGEQPQVSGRAGGGGGHGASLEVQTATLQSADCSGRLGQGCHGSYVSITHSWDTSPTAFLSCDVVMLLLHRYVNDTSRH
jgi:hypothetical protein